jgi:hypothetical protein
MEMSKIKDDIISYREMCDIEKVQTLQRGMNYRLHPAYSVFLMSQRVNAPYSDKVQDDGITIEYEGHDAARKEHTSNPKTMDQVANLPSGKLTQNGLFIKAVEEYKRSLEKPEVVKIYEKVIPGVWSLKGFFDLVDYKIQTDGSRNVFRFILRLSELQDEAPTNVEHHIEHSRVIPSHVKMEVWKRDDGRCVVCGSTTNLHFDHSLPFAKGGTGLTAKNVQLLCMKHNLEKSDKIQ